MQTVEQYVERRRQATLKDIERAKGSRRSLLSLIRKRKELAQIFAEDGAIETAETIEAVDIALLEQALSTAKMILCAVLLLGLTGCVHANLHSKRLGGNTNPRPHPVVRRTR